MQNWTASGDGTQNISTDFINKTVQFEYGEDSSYGWSEYIYSAVAKGTKAYNLNWSYQWNHCWFLAKAEVEVFVDGPGGTTNQVIVNQSSYGSDSASGNITIDVTKDYSFGVRIKAYHSDSSRFKRGTFTFTEQ